MKYLITFLLASLFSLSLSANEVQCGIQAQNEAIKIAIQKDLTRAARYVDTEIESVNYTSKLAKMLVKASFTSAEEHEFLRIEMALDLSSCKVLKAKIVQDSRE